MEKAKELLKEYGTLMGRADADAEKRLQEIRKELASIDSPEVQKLLDDFLVNKLFKTFIKSHSFHLFVKKIITHYACNRKHMQAVGHNDGIIKKVLLTENF